LTVPSSATTTSVTESSTGAATTVLSSVQTTAEPTVSTTGGHDRSPSEASPGITCKMAKGFLDCFIQTDSFLNKQKSSFEILFLACCIY